MSKSRKLLPLPLIAATLTAGATATYSPIGCGCTDAWINVALAIDRPDMTNSFELTPRLVADGLAKQLTGKKVQTSSLPIATSTSDCALAVSPERTIRCRLWLWEGQEKYVVDYKGFDVIVTTDAAGMFRKVQVIPIAHGPRT
jgi:hypothetical protein